MLYRIGVHRSFSHSIASPKCQIYLSIKSIWIYVIGDLELFVNRMYNREFDLSGVLLAYWNIYSEMHCLMGVHQMLLLFLHIQQQGSWDPKNMEVQPMATE